MAAQHQSDDAYQRVTDDPAMVKWREYVSSVSDQGKRYEMVQFTYDTIRLIFEVIRPELEADKEVAFEDGYADGFKAGIKHATRVMKNGGLDPNRPDPYTDIARRPKRSQAEVMEDLTYDTPGVIK